MNKDRFSDRRLAQISSLKELRNTRRKISNRLDILEDKFEHNRWALFNVEGAMQGLVHKVESVREAWDRVAEIIRGVRDRSEKCIGKATEKVKEKVKEKIQEKAQEKATKAKNSKNKTKQPERLVERADKSDKKIAEQSATVDTPEVNDLVEIKPQDSLVEAAVEVAESSVTAEDADVATDALDTPIDGSAPKSRRRRGGRRRKSTTPANNEPANNEPASSESL